MFSRTLAIIQVFAFAMLFQSVAFAAPLTFNVDGVISDSSNQPLESASVTFRVDVQDSTGSCTLYREEFPVSMTGSNGYFSLVIGKQTNMISSATLDKVFSNEGVAIAGSSCTYTPTSKTETRKIVVSFNDGTTQQLFSSQDIQSVPYAVEAGQAHRLTTALSGDVSGTQTAIVVDKIKGVPVDMTGVATGKILKYQSGSFVIADDLVGTGLTSLNGLTATTQTFGSVDTGNSVTAPSWTSSGSAHTLKIPMASGTGVSAGLISNAEYATFLNRITSLTGDVTAAGSGAVNVTIGTGKVTSAHILDGTIVGADMDFTGTNAATTGLVLKDASGKFVNFTCSTASDVLTWTAAGWACQAPAATGITSLNGQTGSTQNLAAAASGSATALNYTFASNTHTLNIPMASTASVTAGLLSNADYLSLVANSANKLPLAGGTMSGSITMGSNNLVNVGNLTMVAGGYLTLPNTATSGATAGQVWYDAGVIKYYDGTTAKTLGTAGGGILSFNGLTGTTQTLATNTTGTDPAFTSTGSSHTLNIPMASNSGANAGLISNTDYLLLKSRQGNTLAAGQVWVGNASGTAEAMTLSSDISAVSNTGAVTVAKTTTGQSNKILSLDGSGVGTMAGLALTNSGTVNLQASTASSNYTLKLPSASPTGTQIMQVDALGNLTWIATPSLALPALSQGKIWIGNAANGLQAQTMGGDATIDNSGVLTLKNTGTAGTYFKVATDAQGRVTSGSALLSADVVSALGFTPTAGTTSYVNGGNAFTGNATIGLNDNYNLGFKTAGTTQMTITSTGKIGFGTNTPGAKVHITASSAPTTPTVAGEYLHLGSTEQGASTYRLIGFGYNSSEAYSPAYIGFQETSAAGSTKGDLVFGTRTSTSDVMPTEAMRITSTGYVGIGTASPGVSLDLASKTDAVSLPKGTTAQRPANAVGLVRYNTDLSGLEYNNGTVWNSVQPSLGYTPVNKAGDTMSGDLMMAAGKYIGLGSTSTAGTVAGQIWYDSGVIKYWDGSATKTLGVSGAGITSFNGSTTTTQTLAIGTTGNLPGWSTNTGTGVHTLNIPYASASGTVTGGVISNTDYVAMMAKQSSSLASGNIWIGNSSGAAVARGLSGDISMDNAGLVTLKSVGAVGTYTKVVTDAQGRVTSGGALLSADVVSALGFTPSSSANGFTNGGNAFSAAASLGTIDNFNLNFQTNGATRVTIDTNGKVGIGTTAPNASLDLSSKTDAIGLPKGTAGTRPGTLVAGMVRYNTTTNLMEFTDGTSWYSVGKDLGFTPLNKAGDAMTGALAMGGNDITGTGNITMSANKYLTLSSNATTGTTAGQMWYDSGIIKYFDGTTVKSLGIAGAGVTSINGISTSAQSFAIGASGTSPAFSSATSTHTLNIPMASNASVTAGLLSNVDYTSMMAKQSNSLAAGQMWVGNASGVAQGFALSGDVASVSNTGLVTINKTASGTFNTILALDGSGVANAYGFGVKGTTSGIVTIQAAAASANYSLALPSVAPTNNQILQSNGSGALTWVSNAANVNNAAALTNGSIWIGNGSGAAAERALSGDLTISNVGLVTLKSTGTVGTYYKVITDAQGRVISGIPSLSTTDLPTLADTKIWIGNSSSTATPYALSGDLTMSNIGLVTLKSVGTAGTYTKLVTDAQGRVTSGSAMTNADIVSSLGYTPLNKAGDTMTAALSMGNSNITSVNMIGVGTASPSYSLDFNGKTDAIRLPAGTTAQQPTNTAGLIRYNTTNSNVEFNNGTSWTALATAGAGITSFNGLTGTSQTLANSVSGTTPTFVSTGSTHTLNIPMANTTSVTAGLISKTEYDTFNSKLNGTLSNGNIFVGNTSNVAMGVTMSGDATISNAGLLTVTKTTTGQANKILSLDGSGVATMLGLNLVNTGTVTLQAQTASSSYVLRLPASSPAANQIMVSDSSGNLTWATNSALGYTPVNKAGDTMSGTLEVSGNIQTNQGQVYASQNLVASGGTVDFNTGNVQIVQSPGGSTITLNNMKDGGSYTVIVTDSTSRQYTFSNCTNPHFVPANDLTTAGTQSIFTILKVTIGGATHCYISWVTGF